MCKFLLNGCMQIIFKNYSAKRTFAFRFLMLQAVKKARNYQNLTTESGSRQRLSL